MIEIATAGEIRELAPDVEYYRPIFETAWSDDTAHPDYRPLPESMPPSYGQCIPTSCVLFDELRRDALAPGPHSLGLEGYPLLARGRVLAVSIVAGEAVLRRIIDKHLWISWQHPRQHEMGVIDLTSDQAEGGILPPCVVATHDELLDQGIVYHIRETYESVEALLGQVSMIEPGIVRRVQLLQNQFHRRLENIGRQKERGS